MTATVAARAERKLPFFGSILSGLAWALILWAAGGPVTDFFCRFVDSPLAAAKAWSLGLSAHVDTSSLAAFLWWLAMALVSFAWALLMFGLAFAGGLLQAAQWAHAFPFLGFLYGVSSERFAGPLGRIAGVFGVSAIEIFTSRRLTDRFWALLPWLFLAFLVWGGLQLRSLIAPRPVAARPGVEEFTHYTPTGGWEPMLASPDGSPASYVGYLEAVDLSATRLIVHVRFENRNWKPTRFYLAPRLGITINQSSDEYLLTREKIVPIGDDGHVPLGAWVQLAGFGKAGASVQAAYYFPRPRHPYQRWNFFCCPTDGSGQGWWLRQDRFWFVFDLTQPTR